MPLVKKLSRVGNSSAILLDKPLLQQLDLEQDSEVEITVRDKAIIITPHRHVAADEATAIGRRLAAKRRKALERLAK
jgi:antitoxin component of MazEF toxin-antitoxin module